ncbi:hypothetical protein DMZ43_03725 [Meridianimaribacter sp. CL38]|uniref:hypothetical protein n=1 Tax=Meridianimaribacter sp. CL38 TaxID=2213021 RepID=UPI00103A64F5|nr:hypothetical protein [Meridianimaribacter sp. CL38]TBV28162.1 hypothetical protein DMZ43_03725 [Meridianimaribacter sp. CL38]
MNNFSSLIDKPLKHYSQWDFLVFILLTALSIWSGQTTVFYIIYFFWWNELIRIMVDRICFKHNKNAVNISQGKTSVFGSFIQMGVYFVFIVVFFAFMANWNNDTLILINMRILFFQNWFFNINLVFVAVERILLHSTQQPLKVSFGNFTPNMLILHVSIILGVVLMLFVVRNFPETFTPNNLWGSVIIILPFLLIRAFALRFKLTS